MALEGIGAQSRSEEVRMAMDALKSAKRSHAIVSFIADIDATDLGASLFFFFGINEADRYRQSTN